MQIFNATLEILEMFFNDHKWTFVSLPRCSINEATGQAPADIIFWKKLRLPVVSAFGHLPDHEASTEFCWKNVRLLSTKHCAVLAKVQLESDEPTRVVFTKAIWTQSP